MKLFLCKDDHLKFFRLLTVVQSSVPAKHALIRTQNPVFADSMSGDLVLKVLFPMLVEVDLSSVVRVIRVGAGNVEDGPRKVDHAVR